LSRSKFDVHATIFTRPYRLIAPEYEVSTPATVVLLVTAILVEEETRSTETYVAARSMYVST
jgi:hypothetical protein